MIDSIKLLSTLPKVPSYKAAWAPIYFEPIMGSGERLTVAVVAIAENGEFKINQSIRQDVVKAMYGNKSEQFNSLIQLIISNLTLHLSKIKNLENWCPPMQGVTLGKIKQTYSTDITGVLRQAVMLSASMSSLDFYSNDEENEQYSSENTWSKLVKDAVLVKHAHFSHYFNQQFKVTKEARAAKIFFLSDRSAINTERLRPSNISTDLDKSKARLLDLFAVKDHEDFFQRQTHELIVYRPYDDEPIYSKPQIKRMKDAFLTLEEIGDKHSIIVTSVHTVQEALKRIVGAELN